MPVERFGDEMDPKVRGVGGDNGRGQRKDSGYAHRTNKKKKTHINK